MPKLTQKTNKAKVAKTLPQDATKNVEEKGLSFINSLSWEIQKLSIPRFRCQVAEILEHKHNDEIEKGKCILKLLPNISYHCYEGTGTLTKKDYEKFLRQNLWPRINDAQEHWSQQGIEKPKLLILRLDTMPTSLGNVDSIDSLLKTALV